MNQRIESFRPTAPEPDPRVLAAVVAYERTLRLVKQAAESRGSARARQHVAA
jgi:hypothetical protein